MNLIELLKTLEEYLAMPSLDGKMERQQLRLKLAKLRAAVDKEITEVINAKIVANY